MSDTSTDNVYQYWYLDDAGRWNIDYDRTHYCDHGADHVVVARADFDNLAAALDVEHEYVWTHGDVYDAARRLVDNHRRAAERDATRSDDSAGR